VFTQVIAVGATTITLNPNYLPGTTNGSAPVGSANVFNALGFNPSVPDAHLPYSTAGLALILDPKQSCSRAVGITGSASSTGGNVTIRGVDVYGQPQSETIAAPAGATTVWGKKTYKWFLSATPAFTDAHGYTVVTSDTFGFTCRSDFFEAANIFYNGSYLTAQSSTTAMWVAADRTNPATLTTGDVRGTVQVSARGSNSGTVTSTAYTDGTKRVSIYMTVPLSNLTAATPNNPAPLYGVLPFTN
jgi:hypothetical protein